MSTRHDHIRAYLKLHSVQQTAERFGMTVEYVRCVNRGISYADYLRGRRRRQHRDYIKRIKASV